MIVYHVSGRVVAFHENDSDAPAGSYPGTSRVTLSDGVALPADESGETWLPEAYRSATADDVRAEAGRRMQAMVGARDAAHLQVIIANASREAIRLLKLGAGNWTSEQALRVFELETVDAGIEHIRSRSNAMEGAPPADYTDDERWS
ncbi:MAG: hypothetical protein KJ587_08800 [Alphaproteobacteria bacterium]|nr:hypothetical protein [Alphaproteobacteria bacterium]